MKITDLELLWGRDPPFDIMLLKAKKYLLSILIIFQNLPCASGYSSLDSLLDHSVELIFSTQYDSALSILNSIRSKHPTYRLLHLVHINLGQCYQGLNQLDSASDATKKAIEIAKSFNDSAAMIQGFENLGKVYFQQGKYSLSEEAELNALRLSKSTGKEEKIASINNSVGNILNQTRQYRKALPYLIEAYLTVDNNSLRSAITNNLANSYDGLELYDSAILYYKEAAEIAQPSTLDKAIPFNNIGEVYLSLKEYDSAQYYLKKALVIKSKLQKLNSIAYSSNMLAEVFLRTGKLESAVIYLDSAHSIARKIGARNVLMKNLELQRELYQVTGQYEKALSVDNEFDILKDSVFKEEQIKVLEIQSAYELEQKERERQLAEQQTSLANANAQRQTTISWSIGGAALIFLVLAAFIYQAREKIAHQKKVIENQKNDIIHLTRNSFNTALQLLREIGLDLRDPSLTESAENTLTAFATLQNYLYVKKEGKNIPVRDSLKEWKKHFMRTLSGNLTHLQIQLEIDDVELPFQPASLVTLIVNELAMNSRKHAFISTKDPQIHIRLNKTSLKAELTFSDNGKGFAEEFMQKRKSGKGWKIIERYVEGLKGTINVVNNNGGQVAITFPV